MSELKKIEPELSQITKTSQNQGKILKFKAKALKPPYFDIDNNNNHTFYLVAVLEDSSQKDMRCTKEVWKQIEKKKLDAQLYMDFILYTAPDSKVINRIDVVPKQRNDYSDQDSSPEITRMEADILIFSYSSDGTVSLKYKPKNVSLTTVEEILQELGNLSTIKEHDIILDKYLITEIRQGRYIYVDPREM